MSIRIVIADDESITRMDLREILEAQGYEVVGEAGDGIDAVELCESLYPDIAILDIKMPVMDGLTAARVIHERNAQIGIVMLTAFNDRQFVEKAGDFGVVGYLVKPVSSASITPVIEIAARRNSEMNELRKELAEQKRKLEDRKVIDRAKGILMQKNQMSEEKAYEYLRSVSMNKRKTIREVAQMIIDTDRMMNG